jgi:hypothetical protein
MAGEVYSVSDCAMPYMIGTQKIPIQMFAAPIPTEIRPQMSHMAAFFIRG